MMSSMVKASASLGPSFDMTAKPIVSYVVALEIARYVGKRDPSMRSINRR